MFRRLPPTDGAEAKTVRFTFAGGEVAAFAGESVASALLRADVPLFRQHPIDASPRKPFCMMGVCQECLVNVEERGVRRACLQPVQEGLQVEPVMVAEVHS